jgi:hypothetical protein
VEQRHEQYSKLVIGVEDPAAAIQRINAAVRDLNSDGSGDLPAPAPTG